jgi:hypothetical protein
MVHNQHRDTAHARVYVCGPICALASVSARVHARLDSQYFKYLTKQNVIILQTSKNITVGPYCFIGEFLYTCDFYPSVISRF